MPSETKLNEESITDDTIQEVSTTTDETVKKESKEEEEVFDIDDVDVDDVYPDQAKDMHLEMNVKKKCIEFSISTKLVPPHKLSTKLTDFVVTDNTAHCWAYDKKVKEALMKIIPFNSVLVTLHYPEEIQGMDNKLIYKNFIKYVKSATIKMEEWGKGIESNLGIIKTICSDATKNVSWLNQEQGWFGNNNSERRAMYSIRKNGAAAMKALDVDLKEINNQLSTLKIVSESSKSKRDLLVREYLKKVADLKIEKLRLKYQGEAEARQTKFDAATAKLLKQNKTDLADQRAEFMALIKKNNETHQKEMDDLNAKHQIKIDAMILKAQKDLEAQALKFQKVLDDVNSKHAEAIKDLHEFYEDKIAKITAAFEKTIDDLKEIIRNYEKKLEEANKLIAKYYSALDQSQKTQADMLLEFKNISKDKVNAIEDVLNKESRAASNTPKPIMAANAQLSGSLGLNAALGAINEKEQKELDAKNLIIKQEKDKKAEEEKKEALIAKAKQDKNIMVGIAGLGLAGMITFVLTKQKDVPANNQIDRESDEIKKKKKKKNK